MSFAVLRTEVQAQKSKRKAAPKKRKAANEPADETAAGEKEDQGTDADPVRGEEAADEEMQEVQTG